MNHFQKKQAVEAQSEAIVLPMLRRQGWAIGEHFPPRDPRGDYPISRAGMTFNIELKAEEKTTGNLFIEEFSNYMPGIYTLDGTPRTKLGWLLTLQADFVFYHFLDTARVYRLDILALQLRDDLIYNVGRRKVGGAFEAGKQRNASIGWVIPITLLENEGLLTCL